MKPIYPFKISLFISIFFILSNLLNAQVVYTDVIPDHLISGEDYHIDINNDGVNDLYLDYHMVGNQQQHHYTKLHLNANVSIIPEYDWETSTYVSSLGDTIGSNSNWAHVDSIIMQLVIQPDGVFFPEWYSFRKGYIALRIEIEDQFYYGYLRLYYNNSFHYELTLADFVICSLSNSEIIAGVDIPNGASSLYAHIENEFHDGRDITATFTKSIDESPFSEYRVYVAKHDDENADNLQYMSQLPDEYYFSIPTNMNASFNFSQALLEGTKSIDGDTICPFIDYRIHLLNISNSGEPSQNILSEPSDLFHLTKPLRTIEKVIATDVNNTSTAEDIKVIFSEVQEELPIQEYRIFVVNWNNSDEFNAEAALQLDETYYTQQIAGLETFEVTLKANQLTTSGENIHDNACYKVFILSVVEEESPYTSALSLPSRKIILRNSNPFYAGQKMGENISWYTYDTVLSSSPVWGNIDEQNSSGTNHIDINRDGQTDFKLYGYLYEANTSISFERDYNLVIRGERENKVLVCEHEYHYNNWVEVLNKYETISQDYPSSSEQLALIRYEGEKNHETGAILVNIHKGHYPGIPNIAPDQDYYIGLEINDSEIPQYAWIKLNGYRIIEYGFQDLTNGIESNVNSEQSFEIFPNPSNGIFQIKSNKNSNQKYSVNIMNNLGAMIAEFEMNNSDLRINTENYPAGLYFIQIYNSDGIQETHKLIIR